MMKAKNNCWSLGTALSLAAALALTGQVAQASMSIEPATAAAMTNSVVNAAAQPGSQAFPSFVFTFDTDYDLAVFEFTIQFDPAKLSFIAGASTLAVGGSPPMLLPTSIPTVLQAMQAASPDFQFSTGTEAVPIDKFNVNFSGAYGNPFNFFRIPAGTSVTMTGAFNMLPAFSSGVTDVRVFGYAGDTSFGEMPFDMIATVTAVPEPETWLMLLGGLALVASRIRRRKNCQAPVGLT